MFELQITGSFNRQGERNVYTVKQGRDGVVYCSCPAWRFQKGKAAAVRSCKHLVKARTILAGQLQAAQV